MKRELKYALNYKGLIAVSSISMIIALILDLCSPLLSRTIVDRVLRNGEMNLLVPVLVGYGIIAFSRSILGYCKEFIADSIGQKVNYGLKKDLFKHLQTLPYKYFDGMNTGEIMSRMGEDIDNVWRTVGFGLMITIEQGTYFVLAAVMLFYINWKLALISLVTMPILAYLAVRYEKEDGETYEKISDQGAVINTTAQENIAGVRLVKAFARERHEIMKFLGMNRQNLTLNMEQSGITAKYYPLMEFLSNLSVAFVICIGGILVIKKELTLGDLMAYSQYIWMMIWPMRMLGWLTNLIAQAKASAKKINKIFDIEPEIANNENCIYPDKISGNVSFRNVSFKYNSEYVLKNLSFEAESGQTIAIMGTTGAGKSTITNLIGRYYDASEGEVCIDGINVKNLDLKTLRKSMAVVPQDTFLFSETIETNVGFSKGNAAHEEIEGACKAACAHEFISELEDGYKTIIGERGVGLSGGQKQRIAIARALLRESSILVLDDSTSALDMETEFELLKNLQARKAKATTFIIAHRISAVKNADLILFVDKGRIAERGTHEELLKQRGMYYQVYCQQFRDFEGDASMDEVI
jgi:ATP-binding cassette subfamily B protein